MGESHYRAYITVGTRTREQEAQRCSLSFGKNHSLPVAARARRGEVDERRSRRSSASQFRPY